MQKLLVCAIAVVSVLSGAAARADDVFQPVSGPATQFSGPEAGVDLGAAVGGAGDVSMSGGGAGVHAGFNLQNGPIVGGVEADTLLGAINGDGHGGKLSDNWLSSLRVRGGWAFGNVLAYGTIGPAWATSSFNRSGYDFDKSLSGVVYGLGGEVALTRMITARAEIRHYDFGAATYYMPSGSEKLSSGNNLLMLGVGAHF